MKKNQSLFDKKIELKNCQINGGMSASHKETASATKSGECADIKTTISNDCGEPIVVCQEYSCPD